MSREKPNLLEYAKPSAKPRFARLRAMILAYIAASYMTVLAWAVYIVIAGGSRPGAWFEILLVAPLSILVFWIAALDPSGEFVMGGPPSYVAPATHAILIVAIYLLIRRCGVNT